MVVAYTKIPIPMSQIRDPNDPQILLSFETLID